MLGLMTEDMGKKYAFNNEDESGLTAENDRRNVVDAYRGVPVDAIADDMAKRAFPVHIAIENHQHDFNIGTIVRNANAFNVTGVHIIGNRRWNRRGAMSTEKYLQVYHHETPAAFGAWARANGLKIIGIDNIPGSVMLSNAELHADAVLVFGQEGPGLSSEMQQLCEYTVAIEQYGSTRSVNVGVASGIILYEWTRRYLADRV